MLDFGQNLVGWVKVKVSGQAGDAMTLSHAESTRQRKAILYRGTCGRQRPTKYIRKEGQEVFGLHFTFSDSRYVRVTGFTGELSPDQFEATVALYSDMKPTGRFNSSNSPDQPAAA